MLFKNTNMRIPIALLSLTLIIMACKPSTSQTTPGSSDATASDTTKKIKRTADEWRHMLTPQQYHVLREKGTDAPFTGTLTYNHEKGIYKCAACGNELFTSDMKFDSECGWPSFDKEIAGGKIKTQTDTSHGMTRIEIMCARCDSHLGHLFDDGPTLTGKRYCVNSTSLSFQKQ
jgi:peptide-methionine (R)-S-oxide reductase